MRLREAKQIVDDLVERNIQDTGLVADILDMVEDNEPEDAGVVEPHCSLQRECNAISAKEGDYIYITTKDGKAVRFDVVEKEGDIIRLDSHDCVLETPWNTAGTSCGVPPSDLQHRIDMFFNEQIPDHIKAATELTERKYMAQKDDEWEIKAFKTKAFVPDASELFPDNDYEDFYCHIYSQLEYYKDRRHRIKMDPDGDDAYWWTASAYSGIATYAVYVGYYGYSASNGASTSPYAPVCFRLNIAKL